MVIYFDYIIPYLLRDFNSFFIGDYPQSNLVTNVISKLGHMGISVTGVLWYNRSMKEMFIVSKGGCPA